MLSKTSAPLRLHRDKLLFSARFYSTRFFYSALSIAGLVCGEIYSFSLV